MHIAEIKYICTIGQLKENEEKYGRVLGPIFAPNYDMDNGGEKKRKSNIGKFLLDLQ